MADRSKLVPRTPRNPESMSFRWDQSSSSSGLGEAGKERNQGEIMAALCSGDGQGKKKSDCSRWKEKVPSSNLGALETQNSFEATKCPFHARAKPFH